MNEAEIACDGLIVAGGESDSGDVVDGARMRHLMCRSDFVEGMEVSGDTIVKQHSAAFNKLGRLMRSIGAAARR